MTGGDARFAQADFEIKIEVGCVDTDEQVRLLCQQTLRQFAADAGDLWIVAQHLDIAAHGELFARPPDIEIFGLHARAADAHEVRAGQALLDRSHQVRGEQIARRFAGHHGDAWRAVCHRETIGSLAHNPARRCGEECEQGFDLVRNQRTQLAFGFFQSERALVKCFVGAAQGVNLLRGEPAPLQPFCVEAVRRRRVARAGHVSRHILEQDRAHAGERMRADAHELMHDGEAAEDGPVADMHMAGQLRVIGEDGVMADLTVVGKVHVGHDPVVIADPRDTGILRGAAIEGAKFANGIAIANF